MCAQRTCRLSSGGFGLSWGFGLWWGRIRAFVGRIRVLVGQDSGLRGEDFGEDLWDFVQLYGL